MQIRCGGCFSILQEKKICPHCGYDNTAEKKEANSLDVGTMLVDRYVIGKVLGVGGFGITYLAYDSVLNYKVAIKEYLPNEFSTRVPTQAKVTVFTGDKEEQFHAGQKRFIEEAQRLAKFQKSDVIVHIFDCFNANNTSYIVMEYLEGKTVLEAVKERENGVFSEEETLSIISSVLDALDSVHQEGILHRDIAPDNIFLTNDGQIKLIDFGAARYATTTHSRSLSVILKQGYAPIEQYRSKGNQGPWTDIYALAATMYKMLTGVTPEESMERAIQDTLVPPSKLGCKIDKNVENAMMNALNLPTEARPQSAMEFKQNLLSNSVRRKQARVKHADTGKWPVEVKVVSGILAAALVVVLVMIKIGLFDVSVAGWNNFMLSDGQTRVPNIVNMDLETAQSKIEEQRLVFLIVNKEYSSEIPKDMVLMQSLDAGSVVDKEQTVEVTVSGGEEQNTTDTLAEDETRVPDVQYKSEDEARSMLEAAGLSVEVLYEESETVETGKVISQDQEANQIVKKGSVVTLKISKGKKKADQDAIPSQEPEQPQQPQPEQPQQSQEPESSPEPSQEPEQSQEQESSQESTDTTNTTDTTDTITPSEGTDQTESEADGNEQGDVEIPDGTTDDGWQTDFDVEW